MSDATNPRSDLAQPATPAAPAENVTRIRPTVGRIVLYFDPHSPSGNPAPAIVCRVRDAGPGTAPVVNVFVMDDFDGPGSGGESFFRHDVPIYDADAGPEDREHCTWMPFQMAAAK